MAERTDPRYSGTASYFDRDRWVWVTVDHPPEEGWWRDGRVWRPPEATPSVVTKATWWWGRQSRRVQAALMAVAVLVAGAAGVFAFVTREKPPNDDAPTALRAAALEFGITPGEFNNIRSGMTYDQVEIIVGEPGELVSQSAFGSSHAELYRWPGWDGGSATVMFTNGGVSTKAQFGL